MRREDVVVYFESCWAHSLLCAKTQGNRLPQAVIFTISGSVVLSLHKPRFAEATALRYHLTTRPHLYRLRNLDGKEGRFLISLEKRYYRLGTDSSEREDNCKGLRRHAPSGLKSGRCGLGAWKGL